MNRRNFIKTLISIPLASQLPNIPLSNTITRIPEYDNLISLYGIPYHVSNASSGAWLGINRSGYAYKELVNLIKIMEENR